MQVVIAAQRGGLSSDLPWCVNIGRVPGPCKYPARDHHLASMRATAALVFQRLCVASSDSSLSLKVPELKKPVTPQEREHVATPITGAHLPSQDP